VIDAIDKLWSIKLPILRAGILSRTNGTITDLRINPALIVIRNNFCSVACAWRSAMQITPIDKPRRPRDFLTYDLEWIPGTYELRMVGVYDGERYRYYTSVRAFLNAEVTDKNRGKWFFAHAGGWADIQFIFEELIDSPQEGWEVDAKFSSSSVIIVRIKRGHCTWYFIDSYWLLRTKLANIGAWIGMKKGEVDFVSSSVKELAIYNEQDCQILWHAINEFETTLFRLGGELRMTIASCAMNLFRRAFLKKPIRTSAQSNELARKAYFASRVEVIQRSCKNANYYDINASFPFAMTFPAPGNVRGTSRKPSSKPHTTFIADCEITIPDMYLPPIPIRHQSRVFFPTGKWRTWLSKVDFEMVEQCGGKIRKVHEAIEYGETNALADYSTTIYELRRAGTTEFEKVVLKFLGNSLYGKFSESPIKETLLINPPSTSCSHVPRCELPCMRMIMPGVWLRTDIIEIEHEHVAIGAHITAFARKRLYDFMVSAPDAYYCDTDGFCTTGTFPTSDKLGDLKLEQVVKEGVFIAPKVYRMDDKVRAKGFSGMTFDRFTKLVNKEGIEIERMARIKEIYRKGETRPRDAKGKDGLALIKRLGEHTVPKRKFIRGGDTRPWSHKEIMEGAIHDGKPSS